LGFDQAGREVLSYVDGDAATYPMADYVWSDATLVRTGELLRRYHDLSMGFDPPPDAVWRARAPDPGEHEVICHSDWGPYNAVFRSGRLAVMIDWDFAGPGSRLWDLAWVAHSWCPLTRPAPHYGPAPAEPAEQARRLRLLSDAYGVDDRAALVDVLWERVRATPGWIEERAADGEPAFASMVASGHHDFYRRVLVYMDSIRPAVDAALS
jgi:hypothetical protein